MLGQFFKKLISQPEVQAASADYKGFSITPVLEKTDGRYYTRAKISKQIDGDLREAEFIRADTYSSADEAEQYSITKAKQIIDEQGEAVFDKTRV